MTTKELTVHEELIASRGKREELISRIEVLDKVGGLLVLPNKEYATIQQVADFYEVSFETVKSTVRYNKEEFVGDGYVALSGSESRELVRSKTNPTNIINKRGHFLVETDNGFVTLANRSNAFFPRRAILRLGMLLRDSTVAREVRDQLLNIEEKAPVEVKVADIKEEKELALAIGMAMANGDLTALAEANAKMMAFKNRYIEQVEEKLSNAEDTIGLLSSEIERWDLKPAIKRLVNVISYAIREMQGVVYNSLYKKMNYKYGINIKNRNKEKGQSWLDTMNEDELKKAISVLANICKKNGIDPVAKLKELN